MIDVHPYLTEAIWPVVECLFTNRYLYSRVTIDKSMGGLGTTTGAAPTSF